MTLILFIVLLSVVTCQVVKKVIWSSTFKGALNDSSILFMCTMRRKIKPSSSRFSLIIFRVPGDALVRPRKKFCFFTQTEKKNGSVVGQTFFFFFLTIRDIFINIKTHCQISEAVKQH